MQNNGLLSLPIEILHRVFEIFRPFAGDRSEDWLGIYGEFPDSDSLHAIQSLRLTCKRLMLITTPILFPVLRVSINHQSIEAFEELSRNPVIAAHVRGVVVNLAAYSAQQADDISKFASNREAGIDYLLYEKSDARDLGGDDSKDREEEYNWLRSDWRCLTVAWDSIAPPDLDYESDGSLQQEVVEDEDKKREFQELLTRGHDEYVRLYNEQVACVRDPETIQTLVRAVSRLNCGGKLQFVDDVFGGLSEFPEDLDLAELFQDTQHALFKAMSQPHSWDEMDASLDSEDIELVNLLTSLPIAIADAGIVMEELLIGCFPQHGNFARLLSAAEAETEGGIGGRTKLQETLSHLQVFRFGWRGLDVHQTRHRPLSGENLSCMMDYLCSAASSSSLRELYLNFKIYGINTPSSRADDPDVDIAPLLSSITSSELRDVSLQHGSIRPQELDLFFSGLQQRNIQNFHISSIELLENGRWEPLLDTLQQVLSPRCQNAQCKLWLSDLVGGEFGPKWFRRMMAAEQNSGEIACWEYVFGNISENPLRGFEFEGAHDLDEDDFLELEEE